MKQKVETITTFMVMVAMATIVDMNIVMVMVLMRVTWMPMDLVKDMDGECDFSNSASKHLDLWIELSR